MNNNTPIGIKPMKRKYERTEECGRRRDSGLLIGTSP
jgi:hypothetical protein